MSATPAYDRPTTVRIRWSLARLHGNRQRGRACLRGSLWARPFMSNTAVATSVSGGYVGEDDGAGVGATWPGLPLGVVVLGASTTPSQSPSSAPAPLVNASSSSSANSALSTVMRMRLSARTNLLGRPDLWRGGRALLLAKRSLRVRAHGSGRVSGRCMHVPDDPSVCLFVHLSVGHRSERRCEDREQQHAPWAKWPTNSRELSRTAFYGSRMKTRCLSLEQCRPLRRPWPCRFRNQEVFFCNFYHF